MGSHNGNQEHGEAAPWTAEKEPSVTEPATDSDEASVDEAPVQGSVEIQDNNEPTPDEFQVVDRPDAKLLRQRQVQTRQETLRRIRANPVNGDPITRALRY